MEFAEDRLVPVDAAPPELEALVANARRDRPEIGQLRHGKAAIAAWEEAESKARLPVLFLALQGAVDWSPMRPKGYSALAVNAYNDYFIGVAVGARLDLDLGLADARVREAQAKAEWLRANEQVADTGIPVQVFKARQELVQHRDLAKVAEEQVKVTRKWLTFSAAAYASGTGEAKDVLESVGAHLLAKKAFYDHLLAAHLAAADLALVTGER